MIKFYRTITPIFCLIGVIYILIEIIGFIEENSSLNNTEDFSILLFILFVVYFSISFSLETRRRFKSLLDTKLKSLNTAKKYLTQLEEIGVLVSEKIGKEKVYLNIDLYNILSES